MCVLAAIQFFFTYPETCGKSLEEIEIMFAPGGPKAWQTRKGESRLDAIIEQVREKHLTYGDVLEKDRGASMVEVGDEKA